MSEHERSRRIAAPPGVVFDRAEDLDGLDDWLPRDLHVHAGEQPPAVTVHEDSTGTDARALLRAERDQLRMEWGTRDNGRYAGWLQVADSGENESEVTIHLSFFDEDHAPPAEAVDRALGDSLERLALQVDRQGA
ncbi:SRPBCC family protein [Streptosporangium longisporum]|uniref:SRPBCC family protein n=1 Tax=Streptosporangium longisporum TaxID=46187 RepID=A0ABP6KKP2_9ACTN